MSASPAHRKVPIYMVWENMDGKAMSVHLKREDAEYQRDLLNNLCNKEYKRDPTYNKHYMILSGRLADPPQVRSVHKHRRRHRRVRAPSRSPRDHDSSSWEGEKVVRWDDSDDHSYSKQ
jgi:hypothetical protein